MHDKNRVNIAVCLQQNGNDHYVRALAVMYATLRARTDAELVFYVVHDESLDLDNIEKLRGYISKRDVINFVDARTYPHVLRAGEFYSENKFSSSVMWQVYFTDILPVDRVILLDADLLFFLDIQKVWEVDMCGKPMAASSRKKPWGNVYLSAIKTRAENYFRMGVSLMDLARMRDCADFLEGRDDYLYNKLPEVNKINNLLEQSLFNYFFSERCVHLDIDLCSAVRRGVREEIMDWLSKVDKFDDVVLDMKGWQNRSPFSYYWWSYLLQTPWRAEAYDWLDAHQHKALGT